MMEAFVDAAGMESGAGAAGGAGAASAAGGSSSGSSYGGGAFDLMGGLFGIMGAEKANRQNRANQQWAFSSSLDARRTAVQDRVKDLEAAGLNPVLAASSGSLQGASSVDASAGAPPQNVLGAGVSSAFATAQTRKAMAETANVESQTAINQVEVARVVADTFLKGASAEQVKALTERVGFEKAKLSAEREELIRRAGLHRERQNVEVENAKLREVETKLTNLEALHSALSLNRSIAESDKSGTWWGRYVSPYLHDLGSIGGSAASFRGAFGRRGGGLIINQGGGK